MEKAFQRTKVPDGEEQQQSPNQPQTPHQEEEQLPEFQERSLRINVKEIKHFGNARVVTGWGTFIAFKSENSYAIGTEHKGLEVYNNGTKIYSALFPEDQNSFLGIIYIPFLDCYLLNHNHKIFRKDIDSQGPYLFKDTHVAFFLEKKLQILKVQQKVVLPPPRQANHRGSQSREKGG